MHKPAVEHHGAGEAQRRNRAVDARRLHARLRLAFQPWAMSAKVEPGHSVLFQSKITLTFPVFEKEPVRRLARQRKVQAASLSDTDEPSLDKKGECQSPQVCKSEDLGLKALGHKKAAARVLWE